MKRVLLVSPFAGDKVTNAKHVAYAQAALLDCLDRGESPFASHLLITQVLEDRDPTQRDKGLRAEHAWLKAADYVAVYRDRGISDGCLRAIAAARKLGIPVEYRRLGAHWADRKAG